MTRCLGLFALLWSTLATMAADPVRPLDLKPFVGPSPFDSIGAGWVLPQGRQVIDGIPFQMDGIVLIYGNYGAQKNRPGRTNVNDIKVDGTFEALHLLASVQSKVADAVPLAKIHFQYADGTSNSVVVSYGEHVRNWFGPWHKAEGPLTGGNSREVWRAQFSAAATTDDYLRLFHVTFTNPSPAKEVRALSIESLKKPAGLMIAAMSIGPTAPDKLSDTIPAAKNPFPDLRPRTGELTRGSGVVRGQDGQPVARARIRVLEVRKFSDNYGDSRAEGPTIGTEAFSEANGQFTLPPLPDNLFYKLIVSADDLQPFIYGGMDVKSDPISVRLKPAPAPAKYAIQVRVVDPAGTPVVGALAEPDGVGKADTTSWGGRMGFPEYAMSNDRGEFTLSRNESFTRLQMKITAPGLAPLKLWLPQTNVVQTVQMNIGVLIRGRVVKGPEPIANVRIGISGSDRNSEVYAGHFETRTSEDGTFVFTNLQSATAWNLFGVISSLKKHGALGIKTLSTGTNGQVLDLDDWAVTPSLRLAGQVMTRDGTPLPNGVKVTVSYDKAWDSERVAADAAGRFELTGLYAGQVEVSIEPRSWRLAMGNRSLDLWNGYQMTGVLEKDKDDLLILIEKGTYNYDSYSGANGYMANTDWPQYRPLFGAEPSGPPFIYLAGQVLDDKTGKPVPTFKLTPGYKPAATATTAPPPAKSLLKSVLEPFTKKTISWNEQPYWLYRQAETNSTGSFVASFVPLSGSPIVRIEAPGYLPFESSATNVTTSNIVVRLRKGSGPNGVVLLPDGKPAEGVKVFYAAAQDGFSLEQQSLRAYNRDKERERTTGKDGKFAFEMRANGRMLFVASPAGFALQPVDADADNLKLRLQPWGVLVGTLVDAAGKPMPGVELEAALPNNWERSDPRVYTQQRVFTDPQGRFVLSNVPPARIHVNRIIRLSSNSWSQTQQTWLDVEPGTNNLGNVTYDKPPPPTLIEQLKKNVGL